MNSPAKTSRRAALLPVLLILLALFHRLPLMQVREAQLPGDETIYGIMGMHILKGQFPIYYYGQAYLGTLEAYAVALLSFFMGMNGWTLQLSGFLFYALFMATHFSLIKKIFGTQTAVFSSFLLIFPPVMFWELSVRALGYTSMLACGSLSFLLWFKVFAERKHSYIFPFGLCLGAGLWLNPVFILYLPALLLMTLFWHRGFRLRRKWLQMNWISFEGLKAPRWFKLLLGAANVLFLTYLLKQLVVFFTGPMDFKFLGLDFSRPPFQWKGIKKLLPFVAAEGLLLAAAQGRKPFLIFLKRWWKLAAGFAAGYLPALIFNLTDGEGYRILHSKGLVGASEILPKFKIMAVNFVACSTWGIRPDAVQNWSLEGYAGLAIVIFFIAAFIFYFLEHRESWKSLFKKGVREKGFFFCFFTATVLPMTFLSSLEADRYMAPFYWASCVAAGFFINSLAARSKKTAVFCLTVLMFYYSLEAGKYTSQYPARADIHGLIRVMEQENLRGGMTDYDHAYQLSFYSGEKMVFIPLKGALRVPDYKTRVDTLDRKALVFDADSAEEKEFLASRPDFIPKEIKEFKHYRVYVDGAGA